jgi:hypothetical protein
MREERGDLWDFHAQGHWIAITTNGVVKSNGNLVMDRGCAGEASKRFPGLAETWGVAVEVGGNHVYPIPHLRITSFPTKNHWRDSACISLIKQSAKELVGRLDAGSSEVQGPIYIPRPGCGLGGLDWTDVKPELEKVFDDRFVIVTW